jgi:hypothetical protein
MAAPLPLAYAIVILFETSNSQLRGPSHYGHRIGTTLDKLPLRRQGKSSIKFTNY